jgi:cation transporter-like permease
MKRKEYKRKAALYSIVLLGFIVPGVVFVSGSLVCWVTPRCQGVSDCMPPFLDIPCAVITGGIIFVIVWLVYALIARSARKN